LAPLVATLAAPAGAAAAHPHWVGAWSTPPIRPGLLAGTTPFYHGTGDRTVRDLIHTTLGGDAVRVRVSNVFGTRPLTIDDARLAVGAGHGRLRGTILRLRFGGRTQVTIPVGRQATSDALGMPVRFGEDLVVSLHGSGASGDATSGGSLLH